MKVSYNITQNKFNSILNQETTEIKVSFKTGYYPLPVGLEDYYTKNETDLLLENYYLKTETYNQDEIDNLFSNETLDVITDRGNITENDITVGGVTTNYVQLDTTSSNTYNIGKVYWNETKGTYNFGLKNNVELQLGQEQHVYGKAYSSISNGQLVMYRTSQGGHILFEPANFTQLSTNPDLIIGIATQDIALNEFGYITTFGEVNTLNTSSFADGNTLYFGSGNVLQNTIPSGSYFIIGRVNRSHATQGSIFVKPYFVDIDDLKYTDDTVSTNVINRIDKSTLVNVSLEKVSSGIVDNVLIFQDTSGQKYKRVYEGLPLLRWWGVTDLANNTNVTKFLSALNSVSEINIDFDVDLNGQTLVIPSNKRIHFEKGIIKNGTIQGNNTRFTGDIKFSGCSFTGTFDLREVKTEYFKETTDDLVFEKGLQFAGLNTNKTLTVSRRNYTIANSINLRNCSLIGEDTNVNINLLSISYSGNVAAITINAISTYALEGFRIENLNLKYTGLNTNRVPAILNNSQLTIGNYIRNITAKDFTSYVFMHNKDNYIQEAHFENIRGSYCGGLIGHNSTPTTQFTWNVVNIVNCSIDASLNQYMVEPICLDLLGACTAHLKSIVLQGSKGAMVADTVDGNGKTVYGFTVFRGGWLGVSINHQIEFDGLWVEFVSSSASKKVVTVSGKGGSFNFKGFKGIDNLLVESSVLAAEIDIQNDWLSDYTSFIDNRSQYAGININLKLFSDATNGQVFTDKGDLYKLTKDDSLKVTRKSYFPNQIDMPYADLKNLSINKYYGATNGAVYNGDTSLLTGTLAKEGSIFYTRYLMNSTAYKRVSFNIPLVSNYTPRVLVVVKMRISLETSDTTTTNQVVNINSANSVSFNSRPAHQLGGVKSFTLNQTTRTTDWITVAYMINNHIDARAFAISKTQTTDVVVDVSHIYICKGNHSFIDRDFIETNHSFLEVPDAALSNITSYVSSTEVLVKNKNTFKVLKNGVLKGIGEIFPQSYTTATRPTASSQGVGAMIFDTTINKPIWSNGTNWKDASGNTI